MKKDALYKTSSKTPDSLLTKIQCTSVIDLDTITTNEVDLAIEVKNIEKAKLRSFSLKFHCKCINEPKYNHTIPIGKAELIKMKFPIDKVGNFSYPIWIYGSFYPYIRKIEIIGFRKP